jgi:hypothetical protein
MESWQNFRYFRVREGRLLKNEAKNNDYTIDYSRGIVLITFFELHSR